MPDLPFIPVSAPDAPAPGPPAPAPASPGRHRRWIGMAAGAGLVAGLAVGATALAGASTGPVRAPGQTTPTTAGPQDQQPKRPGGPGPGFAHKGRGGPMGPGIHGEFVVPGPNGDFQTMDTQHGTVSAVSSSSITVKSEDGFEKTYVVDENTVVDAGRDGIADVKQGDDVALVAVVADKTAKAVRIDDVTTLQQHRGTWAPPRGRKGGGAPGAQPGVAPGGSGTSG